MPLLNGDLSHRGLAPGAGPLHTSEIVEVPPIRLGARSYPGRVVRLFYSAGDPTKRALGCVQRHGGRRGDNMQWFYW